MLAPFFSPLNNTRGDFTIPCRFLITDIPYTLSGRIGKVVASHAAVARSSPAEVALIYTLHEAHRGTAHEGGGATSKLNLQSLTPLSVAGCG